MLDQRTSAYRSFVAIVDATKADLGGDLSRVELGLVEAFASCCVLVDELSMRLIAGEEVDVTQHALIVSTMTRCASRLGIRRRAKPSAGLSDYLAQLKPSEALP